MGVRVRIVDWFLRKENIKEFSCLSQEIEILSCFDSLFFKSSFVSQGSFVSFNFNDLVMLKSIQNMLKNKIRLLENMDFRFFMFEVYFSFFRKVFCRIWQ